MFFVSTEQVFTVALFSFDQASIARRDPPPTICLVVLCNTLGFIAHCRSQIVCVVTPHMSIRVHHAKTGLIHVGPPEH